MDEHRYTGSKIKNQFTAYISAQIWGARQNYLRKMLRISSNEMMIENLTMEKTSISVEESLEMEYREEMLMKEANGFYPKWDEMKDQKLVEALLLLREDERKLIYQHIFEERTFDDISRINGLPPYKVKGIYYYAIRKIRKWVGGDR
ncbi:MAG: sigma-70 family RNA polymerase sigma factor [Lachnospiraceae bacterium]